MPNDEQFATIAAITMKLAQLGLEVSFVEPITTGPLITTFRFIPKNASKVSQLAGCSQDIAVALRAEDVVVRRIPGEGVIGISIPNKTRTIPMWRDHLAADAALDGMKIPLALGVTSGGQTFREDLTALPHLLIAGSTNSGKTVCLRSIIAAMFYWRQPEQIQVVLSDTKLVEFGVFDGDPHMWRKRTTKVFETLDYMDALAEEMERRLAVIAKRGLHNVHEYNALASEKFPYLVLVIDELADFMGKSADKGVEKLANAKLGLLVQRARATGVYVIAATQRPSVDVVTGSIKSNFPARLSFRLPTEADSRTILGHSGAEHLLALGDCFYTSPTAPASRRLHSCYATNEDIVRCVEFSRTAQSGQGLLNRYAVEKPLTH